MKTINKIHFDFTIEMKFLFVSVIGFFILFQTAFAQLAITYNINTNLGRSAISPYIYGVNIPPSWDRTRTENITMRRLGGNRMTGYNWENNFSNAGSDYGPNRNDNYLFVEQGQGAIWNANTGDVIKIFHDTSRVIGAYSLMTVPMAGYVSINQFASLTTVAPSADWYQVVPAKGSAFSLTPNPTDGFVYSDEMVNWIVNRYGNASGSTGIKGYSLDNEPDFWYSTHPLIHGAQVGCQELINKSIATSTAVKNVDPTCEIFGYVSYGYYGYTRLQGASDWNTGSFLQSTYPWYIDAYLDKMKAASTTAGKRLVDVLDLHWYTEHQGLDNSNTLRKVYGDGATWEYDPGVCQARMQAPRSFWDASFVENSWITSSNGNTAITLLPVLKNKINNWWPGTKLGFTEWSFSGTNHVSGGIATADMFGILGKYGIYHSCFWGDISNYISSAFKLYRNYDGGKGTFENTSVQAAPANTSDNVNTSVYASVNNTSDAKLHLVVLNKHWTNSINATFSITSPISYKNAKLYMFNDASATISLVGTVSGITGNTFTYSLPKLSAFHIVLDDGTLPLELLDFSGKATEEKSILLNWKSTAEKNLRGYKLERKNTSDTDNWEEIYSTKALNNYNNIADYYYEDKNADQNTTLFYRLSSLENDGSISLSKIVSVQSLNTAWELTVFPNPSEHGFTVYSNLSDKELYVEIKDVLGRIVESNTIESKNNSCIGAALKQGIYYAEFSDGVENKVIKIVKK